MEIEEKTNKSSVVKWDVLRKSDAIFLENKMCKLSPKKNLGIMLYPENHNLLNERPEIMTAFMHAKKFILPIYGLS